ncbi:MAG: hypothetical protein FJX47_14880 [Alphaproteobacteria bacterium]|nr:hypothetical protein [Alphaproteobacteria bacterium]
MELMPELMLFAYDAHKDAKAAESQRRASEGAAQEFANRQAELAARDREEVALRDQRLRLQQEELAAEEARRDQAARDTDAADADKAETLARQQLAEADGRKADLDRTLAAERARFAVSGISPREGSAGVVLRNLLDEAARRESVILESDVAELDAIDRLKAARERQRVFQAEQAARDKADLEARRRLNLLPQVAPVALHPKTTDPVKAFRDTLTDRFLRLLTGR